MYQSTLLHWRPMWGLSQPLSTHKAVGRPHWVTRSATSVTSLHQPIPQQRHGAGGRQHSNRHRQPSACYPWSQPAAGCPGHPPGGRWGKALGCRPGRAWPTEGFSKSSEVLPLHCFYAISIRRTPLHNSQILPTVLCCCYKNDFYITHKNAC